MFDRRNATSPVVGVILMVAITVVLAAVIASVIFNVSEVHRPGPEPTVAIPTQEPIQEPRMMAILNSSLIDNQSFLENKSSFFLENNWTATPTNISDSKPTPEATAIETTTKEEGNDTISGLVSLIILFLPIAIVIMMMLTFMRVERGERGYYESRSDPPPPPGPPTQRIDTMYDIYTAGSENRHFEPAPQEQAPSFNIEVEDIKRVRKYDLED